MFKAIRKAMLKCQDYVGERSNEIIFTNYMAHETLQSLALAGGMLTVVTLFADYFITASFTNPYVKGWSGEVYKNLSNNIVVEED